MKSIKLNYRRVKFRDKKTKVFVIVATLILFGMVFSASAMGMNNFSSQKNTNVDLSINQIQISSSYSANNLILHLTFLGNNVVAIVKFNANGYNATYIVNNVKTSISVQYLPNGSFKYSINNGRYSVFNSIILKTSQAQSQNAIQPAVANTWFDGVYFDYGYPTYYPHPDLAYYQIYPNNNYDIWGNKLIHYMFGTTFIDGLGPLGSALIAAVIGAVVGDMAGSVWGAIAGAVIGAVLGSTLPSLLKDENGDIWWWINNGLILALLNAPWWVFFSVPLEIWYFWNNFHFFRIAGTTLYNTMGITFPS